MAERRVTGATRRARQMLVGGLVAGHVMGILVILVAAFFDDRTAVLGAVLGFAAVVIFCSVGQAIEVIACEMEPVIGLSVVLASYAVRVAGISAGLWYVTSHATLGPATNGRWLAGSVSATVMAWAIGVVVVASRQRVPVYDIHDQ